MSNLIEKRFTIKTLHNKGFAPLYDALFYGKYRALSNNSRVLYSKLVQYLNLALKLGWYNEKEELYVQVKRSTLQYKITVSKPTLIGLYAQLKEIGLIDIEQMGSNIVDKIYIKEPIYFDLTEEDLEKELLSDGYL